MRLRIATSGFIAALLVACLPTQPCACPPTTSLFLVFGSLLRGNEEAVAQGSLRAIAAPTDACVFEHAETLDVYPVRADDAGKFRSLLRSYYGDTRTRCLRLVAYRPPPAESDSVVAPDLLVRFRMDRHPPDSLGLVLRFP
jgi:hypothetical protein